MRSASSRSKLTLDPTPTSSAIGATPKTAASNWQLATGSKQRNEARRAHEIRNPRNHLRRRDGRVCWLATYFFVFSKANEDARHAGGHPDASNASWPTCEQATAGIDDLNDKIDELQKAIKFFESKLPQEKEVDKILKEVWQMAEANSLQTKTVKTLKTERGPSYSEQPIQMSLSGDFNGFYSFLLQLEKLPRITRRDADEAREDQRARRRDAGADDAEHLLRAGQPTSRGE